MTLRHAICLGLALGLTPPAARAAEPLVVHIVTATTTTDRQQFELSGEIAARDALSASFPTGGRLASVSVEQGDKVSAGAELARMESVQQEQALRAAEAGLSTAQADFRQAQEDFQRQEALLERGATTRISRDTAEDALNIAEGSLAQAQAELDRARTALEDTVLLAPADATITNRLAEPGEVVGAAQPVLELALGDGLDALFDVPEVLLTKEVEDPTVTLWPIDTPDRRFTGQVREISPLVDASIGTVAVTVTVLDPPPGLTYGDAVRGAVSHEEPPHIALPYAALSATAEGPAVWVVDPATMAVTLTPVTVDRYETGRIILANGLAEGTLVVAEGAQLLYPGRVVQAMEAGQ